jgi:hypothetical protein
VVGRSQEGEANALEEREVDLVVLREQQLPRKVVGLVDSELGLVRVRVRVRVTWSGASKTNQRPFLTCDSISSLATIVFQWKNLEEV